MKKNALKAFIVICVVLIVVIGSFYFWFRNHPTVDITINKGSAGEQLDIETPNIAINEQFGIKSSAEVELKVLNIVDQHEFVCYDLRENYKTSDIKLDIVKADEHLVLKYTGKAVNKQGKTVDYQNEIECDMNVDVQIIKY